LLKSRYSILRNYYLKIWEGIIQSSEMPRPLSEEQIKEKLKRGDKYKSHVTERGLKPDGVTEYKKVSTWVTLECGGNGPNCKVLFPLVMGKSYMGHCPPCNRDEVGKLYLLSHMLKR
jgi:hypothetical protein